MKWCLGFLVMAAGIALAQPPQTLTLDQAITIGRENNRSLKISRARVAVEQARAAEASAAQYAGLAFTGGYTRVSAGDFRLFSTGTLPGALAPAKVVEDNYILRLGLRQPLFTGFRLSKSAEAAEFNAGAAESEREMNEQDLVLGISATYWTLVQALQIESYAKENVSRLESYRRDTERLLEAGLVTRNDLLKVEVQLSQARIALIDAHNQVRLEMMNLNNILGQATETEVVPGTKPEEVLSRDSLLLGQMAADVRQAMEAAIERRQDLKAVAGRRMAADAGVSAAQGGWWPQIELTASYAYNSPNQRYQPVIAEFLGSWDVGVSMYLELWNWGATAHRVELAEAQLRQAELQESQLRETITLEVNRAVLTLQRSREKISVATTGVQQAEEQLRTVTDKFRTGLATSTDLLDAEVALLQAQTQFTAAQIEYAISRASLTRALGGAGQS